MASTIEVEICAPERDPIRTKATEVVVPGEAGVLSILEGHTPLLTTLVPGVLIVRGTDDTKRFYAVNGGFAEVAKNRVIVLTDTVESQEEIELHRAQEAQERAEKRLRKPDGDTDIVRAEAALYRSIARIQAQSGADYL